jgi:hypothetical protein
MIVEWRLPDIKVDANGSEEIYFENNKNLRKGGVELAFPEEYAEEYRKCAEDIFYFAENYYHIRNLDEGTIKIKLREYQKRMLKSFVDNRNTIVNATRQCGKSTSFEIFVCWYILFNIDKSVAILANKAMSSLGILRKIKRAYELLPKWLQAGVMTWNASEIILDNGSTVMAAATSSSAIRSYAMNMCIIDEMAFIPHNMWEDFFTSVYPTVSSSNKSKTIMVSTPNGMNQFWKYWTGATTDDERAKNDFNPIEIHWSEVPGRDDEWYRKTRSNMTESEFAQEFGGSFLGSALTLIDVKTLTNMMFKKPLIDTPLHELVQEFRTCLRVYKKVQKGHSYMMSVDSAKVHADSVGDAVAIQIIDITRMPYKQVAAFSATNEMHYLQIPELAYQIGKYYNWAFAFVENNEIGQEVADSLAFEFEYENIFFEKPMLAGYRTTSKTKRLGCSNLKGFIETGKLLINDVDTIEELSTFIKQKNGTYAAEDGYHDDLVMSLMGCLFFTTRPEFDAFTERKDMANVLFNPEKQKELEAALEEELPAFGFIDAEGVSDFDDDMSVF